MDVGAASRRLPSPVSFSSSSSLSSLRRVPLTLLLLTLLMLLSSNSMGSVMAAALPFGIVRSVARDSTDIRGVSIFYELVTLTRSAEATVETCDGTLACAESNTAAPDHSAQGGFVKSERILSFVLTPGGQTGVDESADLRDRFEKFFVDALERGEENLPVELNILTWDRRNTGRSSFGYSNSSVPMLVEEAEDLHVLIADRLGLPNTVLYGFSSGARVSLRLAVDHPDVIRGVVACPPTGGNYAARVVSSMYYSKYIPLAVKRNGMEAVAATDFYSAHLRQYPSHHQSLFSTHPATFAAKMATSAEQLLVGSEVDGNTLLGVSDVELRSLVPKVAIGHNGDVDDKIHLLDVARAAASLLNTSCTIVSYENDDIPKLCFNLAKSLDLQWSGHTAHRRRSRM